MAASGGAAIVTPAGSESVNATPVSDTAPDAELLSAIVKRETPCGEMCAGEKLLLIVTGGAAVTVSVAFVALEFVAPCVVVSAPAGIALRYDPGDAAVTLTKIVQVAPAPMLPPESVTDAPPAVACTLPLPQVVDALGDAAIVTPPGSVSVSAIPLSA